MLLREIKNIFHKELDEIYPKEEVDSFFYMLIDHYLGLERFALVMNPDIVILKEKEQPLFEALAQLRLQNPIQYIIGKAHFMEMDFIVNKHVLIPRPETEELVRWIITAVQNENQKIGSSKVSGAKSSFKILDIGTGSGCIAISLAKNIPDAQVYALDVSGQALEVAKHNTEDNEVNINFIQTDILQADLIKEKFDIIVSNPPYVRESEKKEMDKNVLEYEPDLALFVSDQNPLLFYDSIIRFAASNLNKNGKIYFEINQYLGKEMQQLMEKCNFSEIELRKDMFGNDRMLKAKIIT